jgi:hypothetical protein
LRIQGEAGGRKKDNEQPQRLAAGLVVGDDEVEGVKLAQPPATHGWSERRSRENTGKLGKYTCVFTRVLGMGGALVGARTTRRHNGLWSLAACGGTAYHNLICLATRAFLP